MVTINLQVRAEDLGRSLDAISEAMNVNLENAINTLAYSAYDEAVRLAQSRLKQTRADYINNLKFKELGSNSYIIYLEGEWPNKVEDGFGPYDMKTDLLTGPNAQKWAARGRFNYNVVPFGIRPDAQAQPTNVTSLAEAAKQLIKDRGLDKVITSANTGKPLEGMVASIRNTGIKNLEGLTKIQKVYNKTVQSHYMTFRAVKSTQVASWFHPGYKGAKIFPDVERYVMEEVDNILRTLL